MSDQFVDCKLNIVFADFAMRSWLLNESIRNVNTQSSGVLMQTAGNSIAEGTAFQLARRKNIGEQHHFESSESVLRQ